MTAEHHETIVVGGGQAGLSVGYHLARLGLPFLILDAGARTGDPWRKRWDSLRLFTPAPYCGLPGFPFPAPAGSFPTKDEVADYLEAYAGRFRLPLRTGARVEKLSRPGAHFELCAGAECFRARNVVVAMSSYQNPYVPEFREELDPAIVQMHTKEYRNPAQLREGPVLVVGASDSGCEVALDAAKSHKTYLSGRHPGHFPFDVDGPMGRALAALVFSRALHSLLSTSTPVGRALRTRLLGVTGPNIRLKPRDIAAAGIERTPRTVGARDGLALLDDGRVLEAANVIWCTGFRPSFSWIDLPVFGPEERPQEPLHRRGVVEKEPGLYFVGLYYLHTLTSSFFRGVGRDAEYVADMIAARGANGNRSR